MFLVILGYYEVLNTMLGKAKLSPIQPYGKTTVEIRPSESLSNYSSESLKVVFGDKD